MSAPTLNTVMPLLLDHEGGYTNDPDDKGGPTKYGITIHDVRLYVKPNAQAEDVRALDLPTAKRIYREKYWNVVRGDDLPAGIDYVVFDFGVNSGVSRSAKFLQKIVGVDQDGEIGEQTVKAAKARAAVNAASVINRMCDDRQAFLKQIPTFWKFGAGWTRRVTEVRATSLKLAAAAPKPVAPAAKPAMGLFAAILALFTRKPAAAPAPAAPKWLTEAKKDIGFREKGNNQGIEQFINEAGVGSLGDAWCAIFVNAKLGECGIEGTHSAMARSFEKDADFVKLPGPALGAVATFWRGSPTAGTGHTNFYAGTDAQGRHMGVGGNQDDAVSVAYMDMDRSTGFWWPKGEPLPPIGAVRVDGLKAAAAGREV